MHFRAQQLFILGLAFVLVGCGKDSSNSTGSTDFVTKSISRDGEIEFESDAELIKISYKVSPRVKNEVIEIKLWDPKSYWRCSVSSNAVDSSSFSARLLMGYFGEKGITTECPRLSSYKSSNTIWVRFGRVDEREMFIVESVGYIDKRKGRRVAVDVKTHEQSVSDFEPIADSVDLNLLYDGISLVAGPSAAIAAEALVIAGDRFWKWLSSGQIVCHEGKFATEMIEGAWAQQKVWKYFSDKKIKGLFGDLKCTEERAKALEKAIQENFTPNK